MRGRRPHTLLRGPLQFSKGARRFLAVHPLIDFHLYAIGVEPILMSCTERAVIIIVGRQHDGDTPKPHTIGVKLRR